MLYKKYKKYDRVYSELVHTETDDVIRQYGTIAEDEDIWCDYIKVCFDTMRCETQLIWIYYLFPVEHN